MLYKPRRRALTQKFGAFVDSEAPSPTGETPTPPPAQRPGCHASAFGPTRA